MLKKWEIINPNMPKDEEELLGILLANRKIEPAGRSDFFAPPHPKNIKIGDFGVDKKNLSLAVRRIKTAKTTREKVIVYGDYDADGICGTAIIWQSLYNFGLNVLPYIPERFSEGYGLNLESIEKLKKEDPTVRLIITVDHGIVAHGKIEKIKELGIDVIITDHHQPEKNLPRAFSIIHTTKVSGSAVAWLLAREIGTKEDDLGLVAIGTVSDVLPVVGLNRSFLKHGIEELRRTKRPGLLALFEVAGIAKEKIGTYEIGFIIAPRINAMGRLEHAIDSLRLLCVESSRRAKDLADKLNQVNLRRQQTLDETILDARAKVDKEDKLIFISGDYHEGVIGLAASRLVEEFHRPAIVVSVGKKFSKASARSINGFNIVENIRSLSEFLVEGGGHPMAAGFTIHTQNIEIFSQKMRSLANQKLTEDQLSAKLKIDCILDVNQLNIDLASKILLFEPFGIGNPEPVFLSRRLFIEEARLVGNNKHLQISLKSEKGEKIPAIFFGMGDLYPNLSPDNPVDLVYSIIVDEWNGKRAFKLKIRDINVGEK